MSEQKPPMKGGGGDMKSFAPKKSHAPAPASGGGLSSTEFVIIAIGAIVIISVLGAMASSTETKTAIIVRAENIFSFIKMISTIISMLALGIVVYSFIRISELASEQTKKLKLDLSWDSERTQKNSRWNKVEQYMTSLNTSDWKIAILEADNMLDEITERLGYKGETLGERMKNIVAADFPYLDEAWTAHKLRNAIAHKGTDYALSRSEAEHAINIYHRIFKGLGYL